MRGIWWALLERSRFFLKVILLSPFHVKYLLTKGT